MNSRMISREETTRGRRSARRGAALVEGAFVTSVLLLVLFATIDLCLAAIRQDAIAEAARRLARQAGVRGQKAAPLVASWGKATVTTTAADPVYGADIRPILITMPPEDIQVVLEWPDDGIRVDDRIRVTLRYHHEPMLPLVLGNAPIELKSVSTMRIAH